MTASQAIFLSYASQDADAARRICDAMRAAGLEVWFDQSELRGGDAWDASIRKQIKECALFVPMISASTNARSEGYFRLEWKLAVDRSHLMADDQPFFLPVILDDTPEPAARVPDKFRERQWSRLNDDAAFAAFAGRIGKLIAGSASPGKSASNSASAVGWAKRSVPTDSPSDERPEPRGHATLCPPYDGFGSDRARATATPPTKDDTPSIAVLAFANRSASADDEYFSDGLADELLNVLARIKGLRVAARTSAFSFKGKQATVAEIGRALNVATVLEGSVRKSGNRARISVQLVKVADGYHLWSETYDRTLDDIFAVQDDIAQSVVTELRQQLGFSGSNGPNGLNALTSTAHADAPILTTATTATLGRTTNSEAHRLRLQGQALFRRHGYQDRRESIALFERAVALDANYAGAWADLSFALYWRGGSAGAQGQISGTHDYLPDFVAAKSAVQRAIELEPSLPAALVARAAIVRILDWNQHEALRCVRAAVMLAPSDAQILHGAAVVIGDNGYLDEAIALAGRAIDLDPISLRSYSTAARLEADRGNADVAESLYRVACSMAEADTFFPRFGLFQILLAQGRLKECEAMIPDWSVEMHRTSPRAMLAWAQGDHAASDTNLNAIKEVAAVLACYQIAQVHAYRGEADATFTWLEKCVEVRDPGVFSAKTDPLFNAFHDDPRWVPFMQKLGFDN